ncbi:MAG: response regulator [Planctomycetaceae bacterium]|nr:response regulator [Planctomycetaceae bacterium]
MSKTTVMIADDDVDLVHALSTRIRQLGCRVISVTDGNSAGLNLFLADQDDHQPDIVILDIEMPEWNGLALREDMLVDGLLAEIPVIILTGRSDPQTIRRVEDLNAHYVHKSSHCWEKIETILRSLMDQRQSNRHGRPLTSS